MNNTPEHLKPYEAAARIYCVKVGADPDEGVQVPHPLGIAVPFRVPRWTLEAERLIDLSMMLLAMKEAANVSKEEGRVSLT